MTLWRRPGWRSAALLVSLIINLFFVGLLVGHWLGGPRGGHGGFLLARFEDMVHRLPEDRRDAARALLDAHLPPLRDSMETLRDARRDMGRLLIADTLDEAAIRDLEGRVAGLTSQFQAGLQGAILDLARSLTPEERRAVFQPLLRPPSSD